MNINEIDNQFSRQLGLINVNKLMETPITVIGAGAIGSWVVLTLAKMGARDITVYDMDIVDVHNAPNQFYRKCDLPIPIAKWDELKVLGNKVLYNEEDGCISIKGEDRNIATHVAKPKVVALKELIQDFEGFDINARFERVDEDTEYEGIVISAVDNMSTRKMIWNSIQGTMEVLSFIDGRMGGKTYEVYNVNHLEPEEIESYEKSLDSDENMAQIRCSEKSILYNVSGVASHISYFVACIINGIKAKQYISYNYDGYQFIYGPKDKVVKINLCK